MEKNYVFYKCNIQYFASDQTVLDIKIFFNKTKIEEETNMILIQCPFECFINSDVLNHIPEYRRVNITKLPE